MNADEIVRALRCNWKCSKEKCDGCKYLYIEEGGMGVCKAKNHIYYNAADLIESLTAQLAELKESGFCASCSGCNAPTDSDRVRWCTDWQCAVSRGK